MSSVTITKTGSVPVGCGHVSLDLTGDVTASIKVHIDDVFGNDLSPEEKRNLLILSLRFYQEGKTKAQLNADFTAGVLWSMVKVV